MKRSGAGSAGYIDLCGRWSLAWSEQDIPGANARASAERSGLVFHGCTVPGNFELDLYELGKIPDPFFGMNPVKVAEFAERCHVYYTRTFTAKRMEGHDAFLRFEGLDCFAEVYLNGALIGSFGNMLIEHEIDVTGLLADGTNELFLHIRPALLEAANQAYPQSVFASGVNFESLYVRKAPHMYGWDIMPRFLSAGMYRPVSVEYRPCERLEELYLKTVEIGENGGSASLLLHFGLKCRLDGQYFLRVRMECGDSVAEAQAPALFITGKIPLAISSPKLWQPKGRGAACLYTVLVELIKNGKTVDSCTFTHGIRTVELRRTPLTTPTGEGEFVFVVNGEKVFIKGTNWVPVDAFHSRDRERIPAILDMVNDLNCNMLRCWGGNVYEDELFYDICDKSGILVWQDFGMACAVYPQDDAFAGMIAGEAAAVIKRLRNHPCVALWSGDNECDLAYQWYQTKTDPNTNVLTRKILPEAVRLHDGSRPYIGSSPFFDAGTGEKDEPYLTETHLWGPRDYFKSRFYTESLCHFVSEIGYHGCPAPESIRKFISPEKLWPCTGNEEWILHGTSPVPDYHAFDYRVELMRKQVAEFFTTIPDDLESFAIASQIVQAEAFKFFIELFRAAKWRRTGILWWNLIDGWPQFSDAIVDYYFNRKLAYSYVRRCQRDVCVILDEPGDWVQKVVLSNDTRFDKKIRCLITDLDTGETVFEGEFIACADRATVAGQIPYIRNRQRFFAIDWQGEAAGRNHYLAGQPPFELERYRQWLTKFTP